MEEQFDLYLKKNRKTIAIDSFLFAYIRLLFLFKDLLTNGESELLLERQKQLRGDDCDAIALELLAKKARKQLDKDLSVNDTATKRANLNNLLFCALLNSEENDFFYFTEPLFEFAQIMEVSPDQLREILEEEFVGFNVEN